VPRPWLEEPDGVGSRNTAEERKEKRACDCVRLALVQSLHAALGDLGIVGVYAYRFKHVRAIILLLFTSRRRRVGIVARPPLAHVLKDLSRLEIIGEVGR
jgi:hypothetical protein